MSKAKQKGTADERLSETTADRCRTWAELADEGKIDIMPVLAFDLRNVADEIERLRKMLAETARHGRLKQPDDSHVEVFMPVAVWRKAKEWEDQG